MLKPGDVIDSIMDKGFTMSTSMSLIVAVENNEDAVRYKWKITWIENGVIHVDSFTEYFLKGEFYTTFTT